VPAGAAAGDSHGFGGDLLRRAAGQDAVRGHLPRTSFIMGSGPSR